MAQSAEYARELIKQHMPRFDGYAASGKGDVTDKVAKKWSALRRVMTDWDLAAFYREEPSDKEPDDSRWERTESLTVRQDNLIVPIQIRNKLKKKPSSPADFELSMYQAMAAVAGDVRSITQKGHGS